jgi:hypothetical protein
MDAPELTRAARAALAVGYRLVDTATPIKVKKVASLFGDRFKPPSGTKQGSC